MATDIKKQPSVLQKAQPEIIEDAKFYQDRTYQALKIKIDKASKIGKSNIYIEEEIGTSMIKYLEDKGFTVKTYKGSYSAYAYIYW